jgi:hypothetical protein
VLGRELRRLNTKVTHVRFGKAVRAIEAESSVTTAAEPQLELSRQQARYEAAHACRGKRDLEEEGRADADRHWCFFGRGSPTAEPNMQHFKRAPRCCHGRILV